jgi:hypothetical protein
MGRPGQWLRSALFALGLAGLALAADARAPAPAPHVIYYNTNNGIEATRTLPYQVLKLALSKCGKTYVLRPSPLGKATEQRAIEAMVAGQQVDVAWLGVSPQADEKLLPVLFPVDGGLLGYRLLLIDGARQAEFSKVRSVDDLRRLSALQGAGWPDVPLLRGAGLRVLTGEYKDLFRMLVVGRGDYFPRGAYEVFGEQKDNAAKAPGLAVEKTLLLHYPFTAMFYVQRSNHALHDDIYRGLMAAERDGSYKALFNSNPLVRSAIDQGGFRSRRLIEIDNPYLSAQARAIDARYWYRP